jgi:hypothetical protein
MAISGLVEGCRPRQRKTQGWVKYRESGDQKGSESGDDTFKNIE